MAYPFVPRFTFAEFRDDLRIRFGVACAPVPVGYASRQVSALSRTVGGVIYDHVVVANDDEVLQFDVMRASCVKLRIDPAAYGLPLDPP